MTDTTLTPSATSGTGKSLAARIAGIVFSPYQAYADVAARPRVLGAFVFVIVVNVVAALIFFSTEQGREIMLDQAIRSMEWFGVQIPDEAYQQMETRILNQPAWQNAIGPAVWVLIGPVILAGLFHGVFSAILGWDGTFKQALAVVVHSYILVALQLLFVYPMFYLKESMSSPTRLSVFFPFLDETSFIARLLGMIDLFWLWWIASLAIGLSVLYRKRTAPILTGLLIVYGVVAIAIATVGALLSRG